ncbi:MAG TPA: site-specific DNA-methyltransferase [Kofleriaceae bacterium]|nr:site-specific DNA-methyltransferase [Kofleriaceae bacterium]
MPKRPPRAPRELPVPDDLTGPPHPMRKALTTARGTLWYGAADDLLASLPDRSVDLVVADPPYNLAKEAWDDLGSLDAYVAWCDGWLAEVERVLSAEGTAYVCGFSEILAEVKARSARRFRGGCRWLVWYYRNKANLGHDWGRSHESILHLRKSPRARIDVDAVRVPYNRHTERYPERVQAVSSQYGRGVRRDRWEPHPLGAKPRDVFEIPVLCNGTAEKTEHPTQKPVDLIRRLLLASTRAGQLVVDPFVGSGTTALVAESLDRRWLACDADPRYVGLARDRLNDRDQRADKPARKRGPAKAAPAKAAPAKARSAVP